MTLFRAFYAIFGGLQFLLLMVFAKLLAFIYTQEISPIIISELR